jgi:TolB protein
MFYVSWSPSGKEFLFQTWCLCSQTGYEISVMDVNGSAIKQLTSSRQEDKVGDYMPAWSPDGTHLAFASFNKSGKSNIYIMNIETKQMSRVTNGEGRNIFPVWHP